ncbi:1-acyl-sn-glycerol-3-phosphate acyltransferase, partial [Bacteroidota bacterium]
IITVAPHTSKIDFIFGSLFGRAVGLRTNVLIKKEMFKFPLGIILRAFGGIPVDRTKNIGLADQMIKEFNKRKSIILVITPEGTRKKSKRWKKGFYHIAEKTKVYIHLAYIDFKEKHMGFGPSFFPSGNYDEDMKILIDFYKDKTGKHPERFVLHG